MIIEIIISTSVCAQNHIEMIYNMWVKISYTIINKLLFIVNGNQVEFLMELRGRILKLYGFAVINVSQSVWSLEGTTRV